MNQPQADDQRASRLLRNLRKVINHDLPNQVVVVHGLLQLLKLDEKENLSPEGQEHLERTEAACKRVLQTLDTLKKIVDIDSTTLRREKILLPEFCKEFAAAARQFFSAGIVEIGPVPATSIVAPLSQLQQSLLQLAAALRPASASAKVHIQIAAKADRIEFWVSRDKVATTGATQPFAIDTMKGVENRLALLYVQEMTTAWEGSLHTNLEASAIVVGVPLS